MELAQSHPGRSGVPHNGSPIRHSWQAAVPFPNPFLAHIPVPTCPLCSEHRAGAQVAGPRHDYSWQEAAHPAVLSPAVRAGADPQVIALFHPPPLPGVTAQGPVVSTAAKIQVISLWQSHLGVLLPFPLCPPAAPAPQAQTPKHWAAFPSEPGIAWKTLTEPPSLQGH